MSRGRNDTGLTCPETKIVWVLTDTGQKFPWTIISLAQMSRERNIARRIPRATQMFQCRNDSGPNRPGTKHVLERNVSGPKFGGAEMTLDRHNLGPK